MSQYIHILQDCCARDKFGTRGNYRYTSPPLISKVNHARSRHLMSNIRGSGQGAGWVVEEMRRKSTRRHRKKTQKERAKGKTRDKKKQRKINYERANVKTKPNQARTKNNVIFFISSLCDRQPPRKLERGKNTEKRLPRHQTLALIRSDSQIFRWHECPNI